MREDSQRRKDRNFYPRPPRGGRRLHAPSFRRCYRISIHALREEGDRQRFLRVVQGVEFLSTPSARRATGFLPKCRQADHISIHALREEGDLMPALRTTCLVDFYPRPPRGGRRRGIFCLSDGAVISIHALREEGDDWCPRRKDDAEYFYPRPPRGGRLSDYTEMVADGDFYPRPPRGGRRRCKAGRSAAHEISIHALREEGDLFPADPLDLRVISIHALREEGDSKNRDKISIFL